MVNTEQNKSTRDEVAGPTGFEPATSRLTIWRPNLAERRPRKKYSPEQRANSILPLWKYMWQGSINISERADLKPNKNW